VPRTGDEAQTATFALASAAYRDNPVEEILKANNEWHESTIKGGRSWAKIFRPNLGEAFSTAVVTRMLGKGRKPLIQSFGAEPQVVVEHCLAANNIRRDRDNWLSAVVVLCGVLFLPGFLVWLMVFTLRTNVARRDDKHRHMHAFPNVDNAPSNAICRKLGFELRETCEFEFPKGHFMTCNDWRLDLRAYLGDLRDDQAP
jgi:hypothetical protein